MEERFIFCKTCGNLAIMAVASGVSPYCCGEEMVHLVANSTDGKHEKHIPVIEYLGNHKMKVCIGSEPHPMTEEHGIRFICLETTLGGIIHYLEPGQPAETCFRYYGEPVAVYAFCNLHGLWKAETVPPSNDNAACSPHSRTSGCCINGMYN